MAKNTKACRRPSLFVAEFLVSATLLAFALDVPSQTSFAGPVWAQAASAISKKPKAKTGKVRAPNWHIFKSPDGEFSLSFPGKPTAETHFVAEYGNDYQQKLSIPSGALDCLFRYEWEGNVRELRAVVRKAAVYSDDGDISAVMLQEAISGRKKNITPHSVQFDPTTETWRDVQKKTQASYLRAVLAITGGNKDSAAKLAGFSRAQLYQKLKEIE